MAKQTAQPFEDTDVLELSKTGTERAWKLIVWNDEVNTFDWVIQALMEICGHTQEQAEQCALIIHHKGSYAVLEGEYEKLHQQCLQILDRGINATVESVTA